MKLKLAKYWAFFVTSMRSTGLGGSGHVGAFLIMFVRFYAFFMFYSATLGYLGVSEVEGGLGIKELIWILGFSQAINMAGSSRPMIPVMIKDEILNGQIGMRLMRPISYFLSYFVTYFGRVGILAARNFGFAVVIGLVLVGWPEISLYGVGLFVVLALFSFILRFLMQFFIGVVAFWTEENSFMLWIMNKFELVLGGMYMPLAFFPDWARAIADALPFSHMLHYSSKQLVHANFGGFVTTFYMLSIWIFVFLLIDLFIFNRAKNNVIQNGG